MAEVTSFKYLNHVINLSLITCPNSRHIAGNLVVLATNGPLYAQTTHQRVKLYGTSMIKIIKVWSDVFHWGGKQIHSADFSKLIAQNLFPQKNNFNNINYTPKR